MDDPGRRAGPDGARRPGRSRGPGRDGEHPLPPASPPTVPPDLLHWAEALGRPAWPVIIGVAAAVVAIAAGLVLAGLAAGPTRRCGARPCPAAAGRLAAMPPGSAPGRTGPASGVSSVSRLRAHRHALFSPSPPPPPVPGTSAPAPPPTAPAASPSTSPAGPAVAVSYTLVRVWDGGFQGEFTIVNDSGAPVDGWQLAAELPGDQVQSAWDASFQVIGDTVILTPPSYQVSIEPGASLAEHFTAGGTSTEPESCTFNGVPCS